MGAIQILELIIEAGPSIIPLTKDIIQLVQTLEQIFKAHGVSDQAATAIVTAVTPTMVKK